MKRLRKFGQTAGGAAVPLCATALGLCLNLQCSATQPSIDNQATTGGESATGGAGGGVSCENAPTDIYHARIEPLLTDERPKTCNQCHLSGVDLSAFIRATPCETLACLVQDGLVDPSSPADSKILDWILRASPDSELITPAVIQAEYDGFLQWIEASASCPSECAGATCGESGAREICEPVPVPTDPLPEVLGEPDCADAALESLFYDQVYAWRARCFPCHFSNQLKAAPDAPRWIRVEGNCAQSSLATYRWVTASNMLDLGEPSQSLLLLKPLAIEAGGVKHGGHTKFDDTEDPAYQSFLRFIQQYADCKR